MLMYWRTLDQLLEYSITVLDILKHYCLTINMKKWKCFKDRFKFIRIDVASGGSQPEHYKNDTLDNIDRPNTWDNVHIIIGLFGFYIHYLLLYELGIWPWRYILSKQPLTRKTISKVLNKYNVETMDDIRPKVIVEAKVGFCVRTWFRNTRPILRILYQDILV